MNPVEFWFKVLISVVAISVGVNILFLWKMGKEGRFFLMENLFRGAGYILNNVDPAGAIQHIHVKPKSNALRSSRAIFWFLHQFIDPLHKTESENTIEGENDEDEKKASQRFNEMIQASPFYQGCKRRTFFAIQSASIASGHKLLSALNNAKEKEKLPKQLNGILKALEKLDDKELKLKINFIDEFKISDLAQFVEMSYSPQEIDEARREGYLEGLGMKPSSPWKMIIPVSFILIGVALIYIAWQQGMFGGG